MSSQTEEIKSRIDIADLVGSYIRLQKAGANFKANCPFHNERTPSFNVSPARQIWHCFGCGKGGDAFQFVMEIEGVEFKDALRTLADRAGVELKYEDYGERSERSHLFQVMEEAMKFFEGKLTPPSSTLGVDGLQTPSVLGAAYNYLKSRGLTDETIKEFRVGYAPPEWRALSEHLASKGFKADLLEKAGLIIKNTDTKLARSNHYDRFRGRIIFPIFDYGGRVIAFGGRIFPEDGRDALGRSPTGEAKYINSPETPLYQKSNTLYCINKAKTEILKKSECVVVEGYMDAISSYQAGVRNVVASSGTALTEGQLKILKRLSDKILMSFDADSAGEAAAKKGISLALASGFEVRVVAISGAKDTAELVAKGGSADWASAVLGAKHIVDFYIDSILKKFSGESPEAKREFQKYVLPLAASFQELEQAHWVRKISGILNIEEQAVWTALKSAKSAARDSAPVFGDKKQNDFGRVDAADRPKTRKRLLEERILGILAKYPTLSSQLDSGFGHLLVMENRAAVFAELFLNGLQEAEAELATCQKELQREIFKEKKQEIFAAISKKEKLGENSDDLMSEFKKISDEQARF